MQLVLMFRIPLPMDSGSNLFFIIKVPYLLEKGGGISHLGRQIIKVLGSQGLSVEEFLDNFSNRKRNILVHSIGRLGIYLLSRGGCFTKSQKVTGCQKGEMDSLTRFENSLKLHSDVSLQDKTLDG